MTFDVKSLAERKHVETGQLEADWFRALESAHMSLKMVSHESLTHIALASRSTEKFTIMARLLYQFTKAHLNAGTITDVLFDKVNRSPFSLTDWIDATDYFYDWLTQRKRKIDYLPMINYLECCVFAPDAKKSGQTLRSLVETMLDTFDYEAG